MIDKTLNELWLLIIGRKNAGTSRSYQDAFHRFLKDNGDAVAFEDITTEFIDKWKAKMRVELSKTTTNIYLRSFAVVLHVAYEYQLLKTLPRYPFLGLGIYSRNASCTRKDYYLPVEDWCQLWRFYEEEGESHIAFQKWRKDYKRKSLEATGLMLFMYLVNGMNLRDALMLRYDKFYFQTKGKMLRFCRHKTAERTGVIVELPILKEMQLIIDRLGLPPQEDCLVFPYLRSVIGDDFQEDRHTALVGHSIRDRMRTIAKAFGWECMPTPTWARHSFATNLIQANVPKDYVSWAMAHINKDVTHNYIAAYSYEQMVEYNSLLLYAKSKREHILSQLYALSSEEQMLCIQAISKKIGERESFS